MNNLIKFSNEIANIVNYTNIQNNNWKSPIQEQENKIEEIYKQFVQSQKTYNFKKTINKRETKDENINKLLSNKEEVQTLTQEQISWLSKEQIQAFTTKQISWFRPEQISWFASKQIPFFTSKQIRIFSLKQIQALLWFKTKELTVNQIQVLRTCLGSF